MLEHLLGPAESTTILLKCEILPVQVYSGGQILVAETQWKHMQTQTNGGLLETCTKVTNFLSHTLPLRVLLGVNEA